MMHYVIMVLIVLSINGKFSSKGKISDFISIVNLVYPKQSDLQSIQVM